MKEIPAHVSTIAHTLIENGYEAYLVGGSVRDVLADREPKDWDLTTNATPEIVQELFPDSVYQNEFGTVGVKYRPSEEETELVEVTTYRSEEAYEDARRPKHVSFVASVTEDLARRDFTINAIALHPNGSLVDPFDGYADLERGLIRTVNEPEDRFREDALRLLRAIRFACQLDFSIAEHTWDAIQRNADNLSHISAERIQEEFNKLLLSDTPVRGMRLLEEAGLLTYIMPELREGIECGQNKHHIYTVWEHNIRSLQYAADQNWDLTIRMAALLHDVAKPRTKAGEGYHCTFHGHEVEGASLSYEMLSRLAYSKKFRAKVSKLVRYHMFYYDVGEVTESSVRRLVRKVGQDNIADLIKLRQCDRIGSGTPKARPYRLRHFEYMTERVMQQPLSVSMLAVDGTELIEHLNLTPGPIVGALQNALLVSVLENPEHNTREYLLNRAQELKDRDPDELKRATDEILDAKEEERSTELKQKYYLT